MDSPPGKSQSRAAGICGAIDTHATGLHEKLVEWVDLPNIPTLTHVNATMRAVWLSYAEVYIFTMISCLEFERDPNFFTSDLYVWIVAGIGNRMREITVSTNLSQTDVDKRKILDACMKELGETKKEVELFFANLANGVPNPEAPLIGLLTRKMGIGGSLQTIFEEKLRSFTKELFTKIKDSQKVQQND